MDVDEKPRIAIPLGDPNGIGPEIAIKAAIDDRVRAVACPVLVGDRAVIAFYGGKLGLSDALDVLEEDSEVVIDALDALGGPPGPGAVSADAGRAAIAYASRAIALALGSEVAAVVAAPHNETAVAQAGIAFNGYPGLLAQETGVAPDKVFLMLVSPRYRIVHVTLHMALRAALDAITSELVLSAARAADRALKRLGIAAPKLAACGINPHAGEGGLFGDEDEAIVGPALIAARAEGISIDGPAGADLLFAQARYDGYLAMYHDQGHIPVKIEGRGKSFGMSIGTPVLFSTVAHGSAHDIAGRGIADPQALIGTILQMANALTTSARKSEY